MSRSNVFLKLSLAFGASLIPVSIYTNKLRTLHEQLSHKIEHRCELGAEQALSRHQGDLVSIPHDIVEMESQYMVLFDEAVKVIKASSIPNLNEEQLLTVYLRHNMCAFAKMPQAWIIWLMADKPSKKTFYPQWIQRLNFEKGDEICGTYSVLERRPDRVELGMSMGDPNSTRFINGRLVIGLELDKSNDTATFKTQTFMWRRRESSSLMPLERSLPKFFHELASWGLIEKGTEYLTRLHIT